MARLTHAERVQLDSKVLAVLRASQRDDDTAESISPFTIRQRAGIDRAITDAQLDGSLRRLESAGNAHRTSRRGGRYASWASAEEVQRARNFELDEYEQLIGMTIAKKVQLQKERAMRILQEFEVQQDREAADRQRRQLARILRDLKYLR